jgi:hypothetical protein
MKENNSAFNILHPALPKRFGKAASGIFISNSKN